MEIWKDVKGYEGKYQISDYGNVKSLERFVKNQYGYRIVNERLMKSRVCKVGYYLVSFSKDSKMKSFYVHQLVAIAFLNHNPDGYKLVVNHKDFNPLNNHVDNLEIVTNRENTNQKHRKSSSQYTGVNWHKPLSKWRAHVKINGKTKHLGYFVNEYDAHLAYEEKLKELI